VLLLSYPPQQSQIAIPSIMHAAGYSYTQASRAGSADLWFRSAAFISFSNFTYYPQQAVSKK
jgi:hypothetical protein